MAIRSYESAMVWARARAADAEMKHVLRNWRRTPTDRAALWKAHQRARCERWRWLERAARRHLRPSDPTLSPAENA